MSYGTGSIGSASFGSPSDAGSNSGLLVECAIATAVASAFDVTIDNVAGATINCSLAVATASGLNATVATVPSVDMRLSGIGQSNMSGRAYNSQPAPADGAWLYTNDGRYIKLVDPWDAAPNTYSVLDEGASPDGSYIPSMAQHYVDSGRSTLWIPAAKGSTTVSAWQRNLSTTQLYGAMKARVDAAGGVDKMIIHLGESDAVNGTSQATFVSLMNQLISDLISDFGCEVYLQKIHSFSGYASGCATIRAAIEEVWNGTSGVKRGADVDGLTTDVHFLTDTEIDTVGDLTYAALEGTNVFATTGTATASGFDATVSNSSGLTINCTQGAASAVGYTAALEMAYTVAASLGTATASGFTASVTNGSTTLSPADIDAIADAVWSHIRGKFASRFGYNKFITDPSTGIATLYDDDGVSVLKQWNVFEDVSGVQPYRGRGAERRDPI